MTVVIDAENAVVGRLASRVAKLALMGEDVLVVNAEKAIMTGNKEFIFAKYTQLRNRKSISNPRDMGPKYPRRPDDIVRRIIRGMVPYKKPRGAEAFRKIKVMVGAPENTNPDIVLSDMPNTNKYITVGELSKHLGAKF
ncbi:50S ribosomal protein L13 [Methanococcus aeolicus]|jgi:large subunit ribosomal protein L13|uniref:Large ribosomal subunit protein uL13 n=1 Tax=Methanococcus aeolicus (strain ATCC BAA-1280 / DSM 17508 / OCM 812 / Nankai-3) TaxID=419665 RepID=A6UW01_META3|nr:50S ribosomal protein L13 [Methanococcus aeolicus]ABR56673.1 ribosomal protein L13 [Methanococcus aeolicus Nankai-3]UXM84675.1 50S ribosomal protein L13 [Methanococcus aeolicus]